MNSEVVVGILLAVAAKNPYADIPNEYHLTNMTQMVDGLRKIAAVTRQVPHHPYMIFDPASQTGDPDKEKEE